MIVDAHAHIYPAITGLGKGSEVVPRHTAEDLITQLDGAGVSRAVLLQGPFYGECDTFVAEAVKRYPGRLCGALYLDPWQTTQIPDGFCAAKIEFSTATGLERVHPGAQLDDPGIGWVWDELEKRGLTLTLDLGAIGAPSYQTVAVRAIAESHPRLKIVVCHLAQPSPAMARDERLFALWREQIDLGRLPNVWFDTASLPAYFRNEGYPWPSAGRCLREALDRIGSLKILWGSDIPGSLSVATYPQLLEAARLHTSVLPLKDQALVLGNNALQVYARNEAQLFPGGVRFVTR